eukprot:CAMPEP_0171452762 /NCGR_PEP_ID=MMETSP0945-20130129/738_1 /TAXON_ID=109269 /ORGANISM="Vaucheria litorea, Strain CCMP2940" /LENGTH=104 /DNA_ID=CAMNT_0011977489 /DNA_START=276 /DNA_END=590 /DNA_ORIENTATION=-
MVVVGTITDDNRCLEIPKIKVCALRFTETARSRIVEAGGECITFDELAIKSPTGHNCILLQGKRKARKVYKHFGHRCTANNPHGHKGVQPYARSKGRKFEKARK